MSVRYAILAPSYSGKTTAHRAGLVTDVEETNAYAYYKLSLGRSLPEAVRRQCLREHYADVARHVLASDAQFVVLHPSHASVAFNSRRFVYGFVVDDTGRSVVKRLHAEALTSGQPWAKTRYKGFLSGTNRLRHLHRVQALPLWTGRNLSSVLATLSVSGIG